MSCRKCVQLNWRISDATFSGSGKAWANRTLRRRFFDSNPRPNSSAKRCPSLQKALEQADVSALALAWYERHIAKTYKHPEVVLRVICRHIDPVIGELGRNGQCFEHS